MGLSVGLRVVLEYFHQGWRNQTLLVYKTNYAAYLCWSDPYGVYRYPIWCGSVWYSREEGFRIKSKKLKGPRWEVEFPDGWIAVPVGRIRKNIAALNIGEQNGSNWKIVLWEGRCFAIKEGNSYLRVEKIRPDKVEEVLEAAIFDPSFIYRSSDLFEKVEKFEIVSGDFNLTAPKVRGINYLLSVLNPFDLHAPGELFAHIGIYVNESGFISYRGDLRTLKISEESLVKKAEESEAALLWELYDLINFPQIKKFKNENVIGYLDIKTGSYIVIAKLHRIEREGVDEPLMDYTYYKGRINPSIVRKIESPNFCSIWDILAKKAVQYGERRIKESVGQ
jgi:hypothetical protein